MAIRDLCSFDTLANADVGNRFSIPPGNIAPSISAATGRGGTASLRGSSFGYGVARYGLPNHATYGIACSFRIAVPPTSSQPILALMDDTTYQCHVNMDAAGRVQFVRGINTTVATSAAVVIFANTTHHLQFMATIDPSVGVYEIRVDGVNVLSATGANTRNTTNNFANGYQIASGNATGSNWDIDDLYVWDGSGSLNTGFPGDVRVLSSLPNGAGATTNFTPTSGANYTTVDDPTPNTTDYVSGTTVGNKDTYAFADIVGSGTVRGSMLSVYAQKADVGAARGIKAICRSGGTEVLSTEQILGLGWRYWLQSVYEQDPATSALWANLAALNAAEFGVAIST
jgi:hypothetical protein